MGEPDITDAGQTRVEQEDVDREEDVYDGFRLVRCVTILKDWKQLRYGSFPPITTQE